MLAHYGYSDASGDYFIVIDTDLCTGCGDCIHACPQQVFSVCEDDYGETKAAVSETNRKNLKYLCNGCKSSAKKPLPCTAACQPQALKHSW